MKALDIKMLRDLRRMWSQALTVARGGASGVAGRVTFLSAVESLEAARARFYTEARFADVFADLVRAPDSVAATLNTLAGVAQVQTTIEHTVRIDLEGTTEPAIGRLIGLDSRAPTALNIVSVRLGRMPNGAMGERSAPTGTEIEAGGGARCASPAQPCPPNTYLPGCTGHPTPRGSAPSGSTRPRWPQRWICAGPSIGSQSDWRRNPAHRL